MSATAAPSPEFGRDLAGWFRRHARKLTWRGYRDPYAIWVSEVMLQQTRVETVERYFAPFLARFPTFQDLAKADADEVLAQWSGLGYYRRARLLHRGAQYLVERGATQLPKSRARLREIPGVGPYTAGAIASIAFGQPEALVDGNIARVSSRIHAIREPSQQQANAKLHWQWSAEVLTQGRPRELAQALMELGAVVCTPKNPDCEVCPVRTHCAAHRAGLQRQIPAPKPKAKIVEQKLVALALQDERGALLFERRASSGLLGSMWCLPLLDAQTAGLESAKPWVEAYARHWSPSVLDLGRWTALQAPRQRAVEHVFTHRRWSVRLVLGRFEGSWKRSLRGRPSWSGVDPEDSDWIAQLAGGVPTLARKLVSAHEQLVRARS